MKKIEKLRVKPEVLKDQTIFAVCCKLNELIEAHEADLKWIEKIKSAIMHIALAWDTVGQDKHGFFGMRDDINSILTKDSNEK